MLQINIYAIYSLWLREMIRFFRLKSRVVGSLAPPFFFLAFLGLGFGSAAMPAIPEEVGYVSFLAPGIIGMTLLFSSTFGGLSMLWDREFGFLREIMVAPVSRLSIVIGRTAGGVTTAVLQGLIILVPGVAMGLEISGLPGFLLSLVFMLLIATTFNSLGLAFASRMKDMSGFSLIMNFMVFPLFLLSGALFPISNFPGWLQTLSLFNPLTYGVDGLRGSLIGVSAFPLALDMLILAGCSVAALSLGAYLFEKSDVE
ncbi:ABC transporter permease [Methanotrichaceae archaeon M04Ac]|uniref:ABC transporter permease n=1 Tax=Candidatus Methanocrinis alkalitolerans TaxID=3033395 RepID=A0ABT5XH82_9EURY|nr:ABC transporter permease [Candidatus Methanocrinis alkalitolerans]MCR3884280.1 ABC transporter permease [Methanothrix sp.]MDF0594083.1 ABC transporter permease [Candidatus Methanocrinis alkalitolerans]